MKLIVLPQKERVLPSKELHRNGTIIFYYCPELRMHQIRKHIASVVTEMLYC
jgi:hypothetical protein